MNQVHMVGSFNGVLGGLCANHLRLQTIYLTVGIQFIKGNEWYHVYVSLFLVSTISLYFCLHIGVVGLCLLERLYLSIYAFSLELVFAC